MTLPFYTQSLTCLSDQERCLDLPTTVAIRHSLGPEDRSRFCSTLRARSSTFAIPTRFERIEGRREDCRSQSFVWKLLRVFDEGFGDISLCAGSRGYDGSVI